MDANDGRTQPTGQSAASGQGGTVEPANRAGVAKALFQTPLDLPTERFELRDPFAEVIYNAKTFAEIAAKADQIGSSRFMAIDAQGARTTVQKVDGQWHRGVQHEAVPEPMAAGRDEVPPTTNVLPLPRIPASPGVSAAPSIAKMDAQAERAAHVAHLEAALVERYLIKRAPVTIGDLTIGHTEYRFRGDTSRVAFTESTFRLATDTNSPSVARSMIDVAQARNWRSLRVSGSEDFRRMVWLEASVRGVKTLGYEPNPGDLELLKREREGRLVNRIEPARDAGTEAPAAPAEKGSARGGDGRKAVLAAIEAVLVAKRVPEKQRAEVMAFATEKLAQRVREGQTFKVKVFDPSAPSQRPAVAPAPEQQRSRERAAPAR